jgi:hypothetical protein
VAVSHATYLHAVAAHISQHYMFRKKMP